MEYIEAGSLRKYMESQPPEGRELNRIFDVANEADVQAMIEEATQHFGRVGELAQRAALER